MVAYGLFLHDFFQPQAYYASYLGGRLNSIMILLYG